MGPVAAASQVNGSAHTPKPSIRTRRCSLKSALKVVAAGLAVSLLSPTASATIGYFAIGYGVRSLGMAGAGVAYPQDALAAATNPAGMGLVGERIDGGLRFFSPTREAELDCTGIGGCRQSVGKGSSRELFLIPNAGFTKRLSENWHAGLSFYGNGGLNTHYRRNIFDETFARITAGGPPGRSNPLGLPAGATTTGLPNTGTLGVDLSQAILAPTVTYRFNEQHTIGVSAQLAAQRFSARGLGLFSAFGLSSDPGSLTNRQSDVGYGAGVRVGWIGNVHPMVSVGATYASKIYMTKFEKYDGLFADGGSFDIPSNFALGVAVHPIPDATVAVDVQRIMYGDVDSIANPGPTAAEFGGVITPDRQLGASNGIGFGWNDIWVVKVGAQYKFDDKWTFRMGYGHSESPIPDDEILINILAPGIVQDHVTAGVSYAPSKNTEVSFGYMHAFNNKQSTPTTAFLGAPASIEMHQNSFEFGFSWKF